MLDVVDQRGQRALVDGGDAAFHLLRVEAGIGPAHGDDRDIDVWKDVGGRRQDHQRAEDQNQQRQHDEGVGPVERNPNNPHLRRLRAIRLGRSDWGDQTGAIRLGRLRRRRRTVRTNMVRSVSTGFGVSKRTGPDRRSDPRGRCRSIGDRPASTWRRRVISHLGLGHDIARRRSPPSAYAALQQTAQAAKWGWPRWRAREFPACAHALPECRFGMTVSGRTAPVRAQPGGFCDWKQHASERTRAGAVLVWRHRRLIG